MSGIVDKFTLEELYLIRSCNVKNPDKTRITQELEDDSIINSKAKLSEERRKFNEYLIEIYA